MGIGGSFSGSKAAGA